MYDPAASHSRSGLAFGLIAYLWWGLVPLYFAALSQFQVPAWEILAHRIAWSLPVLALLIILARSGREVLRVMQSRKLLLILLLSAVLLAINWLLYIYATVTNRVTDASLGYYMMPLVNAAFATLFLKEKLRVAHYPALGLVVVGVAIPCIAVGYVPWLAVALPVTFGFYGLVRKMAPIDSMTGLAVETLLLLVPSVGFLLYLSFAGQNHMTASDWGLNGLIAFSGIVTVVPLLTFTLALRRLSLVALSFMQFIAPTVQMLLAVTLLGESERLTPENIAAFACIWVAVGIFIVDAIWQMRQVRMARERRSVSAPVVDHHRRVSAPPLAPSPLTRRSCEPPSAVRRP